MKLKNTQEDIRKKNTVSHGFFLLSKDRICYFSCSRLLLLFDHRSKIGHKSLEHRTHPVNLLLVEEEDFLIPFILRLLCVIPSLLFSYVSSSLTLESCRLQRQEKKDRACYTEIHLDELVVVIGEKSVRGKTINRVINS